MVNQNELGETGRASHVALGRRVVEPYPKDRRNLSLGVRTRRRAGGKYFHRVPVAAVGLVQGELGR